MSISGIGIANSYLYKSVNKSNNRENGTALFDWAGRPTASEPQKCQNNRFSVNDAYNSMRMNGKFRSEIGEHYLQGFNTNDRSVNLLVQSNGEVQKVENERYVIDVSDKIEGNWCIYDKKSNESFVFYPMSTSIQTDENTGKDYIVTCYPWGGLRKHTKIAMFLERLESSAGLVTEFDEELWYTTVDFVTVYEDMGMVFTFRDGNTVEIKKKEWKVA